MQSPFTAATIGRRTAELHLALGSPTTNAEFAPEPVTTEDLAKRVEDVREHAAGVFDLLLERLPDLPEDIVEIIAFLASPRAGYISGAVIQAHGGRQPP